MCGIAGILELTGGKSRPDIKLMTNAMSHRGPDADGFYLDDQLSLGHRRLSIIDLSTAANQPFVDDSGRYIIVFNGEMYNFPEVKSMLPEYPYRTNGDTEVLLAAFIKWGPSCLEKFKGMFAFAIWDKAEKSLHIFRDRLGVKPLYYYQDAHFFVFASELRAILASGIVPKKLDRKALPDYLSFQSFGFPNAAIEGVKQLEAGSYIKLQGGRSEVSRYWELGKAGTSVDVNDPAMVRSEIRSLLSKAVSQRLISDVPIGAFLSGGIDSSAVVALMSAASSSRPSTFNISFKEEEFDESRFAEVIARKYNTHHNSIRLSQDIFLEELENALNAVDSPSADGVNTYVVSKAIRASGITVALSGVGGDELFAGYPFFKRYLQLQQYRGIFNATRGLRTGVASVLRHSSSPRTQRIAAMLNARRMDIESLYPQFRRILTPSLIEKLTRLNWDGSTQLDRALISRKEMLDQLPLLSQVSAAEYLGYTQHTLLKDTDQMSMAVSLEVREPFFDHELLDFVLQVPDKVKDPVYPKSLLVESLKPLLPDEIVFRKKQGFLFPWKIWMKNELAAFCEKRITRLCERDFINSRELSAYWSRFLKNDPDVNWTDLWLFVVLEHWMEKNDIN
jgi:asparagine synthase (glutamine-hydrolysing)